MKVEGRSHGTEQNLKATKFAPSPNTINTFKFAWSVFEYCTESVQYGVESIISTASVKLIIMYDKIYLGIIISL